LVLLAAIAGVPGPLPVCAQTLDRELEGLIRTHPEIAARQKAVEAAGEGVNEAFAGFLPRVDVSGEAGPQVIDSPITRDSGQGTAETVKEVYGVRLRQNLFDGFATPSAVRSARLGLEVAEFTLAATRQAVLFQGIDAFVEVLRQKRLVALARESERTIMRQLNLEDERVQRGAGIAVDVLQAKSRLQIAKERRVGFEGALADASARYIRVFDHPPAPEAMADPVVPDRLLPESLDDAVTAARDDNPAIDASLATVEVAAERRRSARSGYYPSVDVVAAANREKDNDLVIGTRTDYSVVVQATWNLFNGFATTASVARAAFDFRASQDNHELVLRQVTEQASLAWHELETARQRVELLENAVAIASEVFDARRKLREAGRETVINVLDAENEVYNARINLVVASADRIGAAYQVLQAMGRLELDAIEP
jgi:adhesin transport system outer membrane protein